MESYVLGIDFAFSPLKIMPMALIKCTKLPNNTLIYNLVSLPIQPPQGPGKSYLLSPEFANTYTNQFVEYIQKLNRILGNKLTKIAWDAPTQFCPDNQKMRTAERSIKSKKVGVFITPTHDTLIQKREIYSWKNAQQIKTSVGYTLWMLPAIEIATALQSYVKLIEVFPHWFWSKNLGNQYKKLPNSIDLKIQLLTSYGIENAAAYATHCTGPEKDKIDALCCGLIAAYHEHTTLIERAGDNNDSIFIAYKR